MNIVIRIVAAAALVALSAIIPAQADSYLPQIGGSGGAQYRERCPQGQVLNGFELRAGDDIDAIRAVCVTPSGPTAVSAPPLSNGFGSGWHGGGGGGLQRLLCPPDTPVVAGVAAAYDGRDTVSLDAIDLYCGQVAKDSVVGGYPSNQFHAPIQGCTDYFLLTDANCVRVAVRRQECPAGEIAIGMHGHSGALVDAMGLICGPAPVFASLGPVVPAMGHVGPKETPLQRASKDATVAPGAAAAMHAPASNLRPTSKASDLKVSTSAATSANRKAIIIVGGKTQKKKRSSTVLQRIDGQQDPDHD
jgi:hypothetical protein